MRVVALNPLLGPSCRCEGLADGEVVVARGWQTGKLNELSCLLPSPSPVGAVETQRVSAQIRRKRPTLHIPAP
jgi:hypothetical protein